MVLFITGEENCKVMQTFQSVDGNLDGNISIQIKAFEVNGGTICMQYFIQFQFAEIHLLCKNCRPVGWFSWQLSLLFRRRKMADGKLKIRVMVTTFERFCLLRVLGTSVVVVIFVPVGHFFRLNTAPSINHQRR